MTTFEKILSKIGAQGLILVFISSATIFKRWEFDNDAWFILNCGRYVLANGIPHTEFATMHEGLHYVMEQWLTAAIFWKIYSTFGAGGLINFCWLIGVILIGVYYKLCLYVSGGNKKISALLSFAVGIIVFPSYIVTRPQIFSTLILLIEVFLLEKYSRERKIWTLAILPVLSIIFVNLHAALYPMLIIVLLPFLAESLLGKFSLPLILAALGIFLAGFVNPYGAEAMLFLFTSYDPAIHGNIGEIHPPVAKGLLGVTFFAFSALLIGVNARKIFPWRYFFLSFGLMLLASQAYRGIFLFLMLATFPLAFAFKDWRPFEEAKLPPRLFLPLFLVSALELWHFAGESILELQLPLRILLIGAVIFLLCRGRKMTPLNIVAVAQGAIILLAMNFPIPAKTYEVYKPALDFLLAEERAENIILWTGFNSGGYAEFRGVRCYLDARPEIFASSNNHKADIIQEYFALKNGELAYEEFFARYDFTHIFVTEEDMLIYQLLSRDKNYRQIFEYEYPSGDKKIGGRIFAPVK